MTRPLRALLICANYATDGHTGGFRWRSMVRQLADKGWGFDVLCRKAAAMSAPVADERIVPVAAPTAVGAMRARLAQRHATAPPARVEPAPVDPAALPLPRAGERPRRPAALRMAANAALDAAEARAWTRAAQAAAPDAAYDVVIATIPEPEAADAARAIARARGLPLVVDFRDPLFHGRGVEAARLDPVTRRGMRRLEDAIARDAAGITDISWKSWRDGQAARRAAGLPEPPSACIPSGHDPRAAGEVDGSRFRILYAGWIWPFMPLPTLIAAAGRLAGRNPDAPVTLELLGSADAWNGIPVAAMARGAGVALTHRPRVPRTDAAAAMDRAAVLVAFDSVCATGTSIPSKLYHYALCRGRMLLIGRPDGAMAEEAARIGQPVLSAEAPDAIDRALDAALDDWRAGRLTRIADPDGILSAAARADEMDAFLRARVGET
ncbi:hypothetical protein [Citreimonas sp.]|uniref:hypothetical protein n=1 Tax=Citreimonas sp. TaxID=3036715 RepID=UPI004059A40E